MWCTDLMGPFWTASENKTDATANLKGCMAIDPTLEKFPAMKWCYDKNVNGITGWIMPASTMLEKFAETIFADPTHQTAEKFNEAIRNCPVGSALKSELDINWDDWYTKNFYLSSTLSASGRVRVAGYYGGLNINTESQNVPCRVRAFYEF